MKTTTLLATMMLAFATTTMKAQTVSKFEYEKEVSSFVMGDSDKYWVKFDDGVSGYLFYSKKYDSWYISNGTQDFEYKSKEYALAALYEYKKNGEISDNGRK